MPFVERNKNGTIIGIFSERQDTAQEELAANNDAIIDFYNHCGNNQLSKKMLNQSDSDFIRVLEDLIDALLDKQVILLTDLPEAAQQKLLNRKVIRKEHIKSILSDDTDDIF